MSDHDAQQLTAREMVRAHAYPVLAAISTLSLLAIALLQIPGAVKAHRYNQCIDTQVRLRQASNLAGQEGPGKLIYLKAVQHCEGL
ncbi:MULTISPECIES: hypothetical protein [unclassified Synechococcus]|jgi:hypothetical protein|uniref:hypothetical protein n=1 Tax=unclassified Synechococcus TaxID=2626047 RepID=UPI0018CF3739|nr:MULTISPECIES: hypothetical protein [unclassified Synechococcus]QPN58875.1 hypothetical protein H8F24_12115 [Synechococcus sp. CBW1002]QPN63631.1 hypothetical protein H8F25_01740 [Synechococcus sp. CBW1004]